jgi:hypothetical protein
VNISGLREAAVTCKRTFIIIGIEMYVGFYLAAKSLLLLGSCGRLNKHEIRGPQDELLNIVFWKLRICVMVNIDIGFEYIYWLQSHGRA